MKVKKGDNVLIIAGKDKGKKGKVAVAFPSKDKVVVEGVNLFTRHQRGKRAEEQGTKITKEMPIHVSNVKKIV